jgi:hypothetical protein
MGNNNEGDVNIEALELEYEQAQVSKTILMSQ